MFGVVGLVIFFNLCILNVNCVFQKYLSCRKGEIWQERSNYLHRVIKSARHNFGSLNFINYLHYFQLLLSSLDDMLSTFNKYVSITLFLYYQIYYSKSNYNWLKERLENRNENRDITIYFSLYFTFFSMCWFVNRAWRDFPSLDAFDNVF